jgi:hypothetical protein
MGYSVRLGRLEEMAWARACRYESRVRREYYDCWLLDCERNAEDELNGDGDGPWTAVRPDHLLAVIRSNGAPPMPQYWAAVIERSEAWLRTQWALVVVESDEAVDESESVEAGELAGEIDAFRGGGLPRPRFEVETAEDWRDSEDSTVQNAEPVRPERRPFYGLGPVRRTTDVVRDPLRRYVAW